MEKISATDVLAAFFVALGIIFLLWYIFGGSPTLEQGLLLFVLGVIVTDKGKIKVLSYKIDEMSHKLEEHIRSHK